MKTSTFLVSSLVGASTVLARSVPASVAALRASIIAQGTCTNTLATGFYLKSDTTKGWSYCGDHLSANKLIYLSGPSGQLADMDIDCDGDQTIINGDTRCGQSTDTQSQTSFQGVLAGYNKGVSDLNSNIHTYVVLGNTGTTSGYVNYNPTNAGVQPLGLVAVVCGDKMFYGIWGDENGDDGGPHAVVGEASISIATMCFGTSITGNNGHDTADVLYLAFTGTDAVPGANGAAWNAASATAFEASLGTLGDSLIASRLGGSSVTTTLATSTITKTTTSATKTTTAPASTCTACTWTGHCAGATCSTADDCDGSLTCTSGTCGGCQWVDHCACASCSTADDCDGALTCVSGVCA